MAELSRVQTIMQASAHDALLAGFVDDASLFPPTQLAMRDALRAHARNRESAYARVAGLFVVPASRLGEWRAQRDPALAMSLSVILDGALGGDLAAVAAVMREPNLTVDALEMRASEPFDLTPFADVCAGSALSLWIEAPFEAGWAIAPDASLRALAMMRASAPSGVRVGAKVRCGGVHADLFPTVDDLAAFVIAAHAHDIPWKATAGLHHPIRHVRAETNFPMHGFLNLACAAFALHAAAVDDIGVRAILAEEEAAAFTLDARHLQWRDCTIPASALASGRRSSMNSYGSCSFSEPVDDLRRLGMLT